MLSVVSCHCECECGRHGVTYWNDGCDGFEEGAAYGDLLMGVMPYDILVTIHVKIERYECSESVSVNVIKNLILFRLKMNHKNISDKIENIEFTEKSDLKFNSHLKADPQPHIYKKELKINYKDGRKKSCTISIQKNLTKNIQTVLNNCYNKKIYPEYKERTFHEYCKCNSKDGRPFTLKRAIVRYPNVFSIHMDRGCDCKKSPKNIIYPEKITLDKKTTNYVG